MRENPSFCYSLEQSTGRFWRMDTVLRILYSLLVVHAADCFGEGIAIMHFKPAPPICLSFTALPQCAMLKQA
uniref:Secreted protein n=1 Tax=Ascaris lumbricoides TaxID=6252 RepID=A0A0M3I0X5_ASCLU